MTKTFQKDQLLYARVDVGSLLPDYVWRPLFYMGTVHGSEGVIVLQDRNVKPRQLHHVRADSVLTPEEYWRDHEPEPAAAPVLTHAWNSTDHGYVCARCGLALAEAPASAGPSGDWCPGPSIEPFEKPWPFNGKPDPEQVRKVVEEAQGRTRVRKAGYVEAEGERTPGGTAAQRAAMTAPYGPERKDTNPKDAIGALKAYVSVIPTQVLWWIGLAMLEGAIKYGRHNYRKAGVRASVYYDAMKRHLDAWWEGEDFDPAIKFAKVSHLVKLAAGAIVLEDARLNDMWTDDRPPRPANPLWMDEVNEAAKSLLAQYPADLRKAAYTQAEHGPAGQL